MAQMAAPDMSMTAQSLAWDGLAWSDGAILA
jgi:hypothetical protein